jgi:Holliday junction resolvase
MPNKRKLKGIDFLKEYKNRAEREFSVAARRNGWLVTKQGYPDFICYKDGAFMLVEVKTSKGSRLKISQHTFMNTVSKFGVKCYKWTPESDWLRIEEKT